MTPNCYQGGHAKEKHVTLCRSLAARCVNDSILRVLVLRKLEDLKALLPQALCFSARLITEAERTIWTAIDTERNFPICNAGRTRPRTRANARCKAVQKRQL